MMQEGGGGNVDTDMDMDMASVMYIREMLLPALPPCVYILLSHVLRTSPYLPPSLQ